MKCLNQIFVRKSRELVPCGRCGACRARKANEWIIRLNEEYKYARNAFFVTLTYDDLHIPLTENGKQTLRKDDVKQFINLLRQYTDFRYFLVAEYGDKGKRPHYHAIVFNFFPVVDPKTKNIIMRRNWDKIPIDAIISDVDLEAVVYKAWKKGIVQVETLKGGAIRYCANYLVDVTVQKNDDDIEKQFALMSKKPPIGYQYYSDKAMLKYHRQKVDTITLDGKKIKTIDFDFAHYTNENGTFGLPRLYRNKIYTKLEQKQFRNYLLRKEDIKNRKIKDLKKYAKNQAEAYEANNEKCNQRLKNRSI